MPPPAFPLLRFGIESGIELFEDLICSGDQQEIKLADLVEVRNSLIVAVGSTHPLHAHCSHVASFPYFGLNRPHQALSSPSRR